MRDILLPITRESAVSRLALLAALLATALAAWMSQGTLALTSVDGGIRLALLPLSISSALIVMLAVCGVWVAWRSGASLGPLWLLSLLALPWLSSSLPSALLIWSGPLSLTVWLAIGLSLAASSSAALSAARDRWVSLRVFERPVLLAGALACAIYSIAAWQTTLVPDGDEPHYLIITQSLLEDHDLKIENNHRNGDYRGVLRRRDAEAGLSS